MKTTTNVRIKNKTKLSTYRLRNRALATVTRGAPLSLCFSGGIITTLVRNAAAVVYLKTTINPVFSYLARSMRRLRRTDERKLLVERMSSFCIPAQKFTVHQMFFNILFNNAETNGLEM